MCSVRPRSSDSSERRHWTADSPCRRPTTLIGTSALDRGFAVPPPDDGDLLRLHREDATWAHIVCATDDGVTYFLRVQEVCAPNAPRRPASSVGADPDEPRWLACRVREFIGTGLLQISIRTDGDVACRKTAKDTGTSSLEEKIPSVFNEFASAMERRRKDRQERAEWEEAKRCARERYACDRLMADMDHQAEQYLAMARRREFLGAIPGDGAPARVPVGTGACAGTL